MQPGRHFLPPGLVPRREYLPSRSAFYPLRASRQVLPAPRPQVAAARRGLLPAVPEHWPRRSQLGLEQPPEYLWCSISWEHPP